MKGMRVVLMNLLVLSCVFAAYSIILASESHAGGKEEASVLRIGVFDSRAVAIAYARSEPFRKRIDDMKAEHRKATEAGNEARAKELATAGPELQDMLHKQGFSTWPVDNILEKIEAAIPGIAEKAGVDVIVSKWDVVYQRPGVELVNITDFMVEPFQPNEDTMKVIAEIQTQPPVSLDALTTHD
jgi:Skp family chaperone for outer membrane proteins